MTPRSPNRGPVADKPEVRRHGLPCPGLPELTAIGLPRFQSASSLISHLHPGQMEICYLQRGRITWWVGDDVVRLQGGDVYLTWPGEIHGGVDNAMEPCHLCFLTVHLPRRPPEGFLHLPAQEARELTRRLRALPQRHFRGGEDLFGKFERIHSCAHEHASPLEILEARSSLVSLLAAVVRYGLQADQRMNLSPQVQQAMTIMERNITAPLLLEPIAQSIGWSLPHFKARFRREVGASPAQHYLHLRVQAAIQAIRQSNAPLVQIALAYGFGSSQYLANCIKRITGKTPSAYRNS